MRVTRALVVVLTMAVFGTSWYAWAALHTLSSGLNTANVIDPSAANTTGPQNILLVGIDTRVDAQGNPLPAALLSQLHAGSAADGADATDTMIVLHIPAGGRSAVGFSIPRDSYVQLAGGYGTHKINSAYTYAENAALTQLRAQGVTGPQLWVQAAQAGAKNAIQTVEQFTGIQINHYAAVDLVGFYDISNAIGGVQVCLNQATSDSYSGANFQAGLQTIQGASALAFVRQRHGLPLGDLDREKRQQVFLGAVAKSILSGGTLTSPTKLNNLIGAIQKSVTLDQGWNVLSFAQQMEGMSAGNIHFSTIPIVNITYWTPNDGDAVEVDPTQVQSFVQQLIGNADATSPATPTAGVKPAAAPAPSASVTVDVYNANGTAGLAGQVLNLLGADGYTKGQAVTATTRSTSVVDYAPGDQSSAQAVAASLGGGITTASNPALAKGNVRVYLGTSYSGPTQPTTSAAPPPPPSAAPTSQNMINGVSCID